jgi:eukaryotic-like serine/threonine-protein kinase
MKSEGETHWASGSGSVARLIDGACDRFEAAWKSGQRPQIEEYVSDVGSRNPSHVRQLLIELVMIDLEWRWPESEADTVVSGVPSDAAGDGHVVRSERPRLEDYVARFPDLGRLRELPAELILCEYRVRHQRGDRPDRSEYLQRFGERIIPCVDRLTLALLADKPSTAEPPTVGTKIRYFGDYELLGEIGRGGMGVVYKARQLSLDRVVALKMILAGQLAGEAAIKRFHAEARAAAALDHPGIVPVFEIGEHAGQHFFSMGYVDGEALSAKLTAGPLPPRQAADLTREIAKAVAYAHEHGVIHRDLKPANILLDNFDKPRITDFGLAKLIHDDRHLTASGQILGTPSYMSPEQAGGRTDELGPPADIYSLGAILYCLLTGRPPFQSANPMDILLQVMEKEPLSPDALSPDVPKDLDTICMKCLQKESGRRYQTAPELVDELGRYLRGEPIIARPIGRLERAWRWCQSNPVMAVLAASAVFSLVAGTLVSVIFALKAHREAVDATVARGIAEQNERTASAESRRADENAASAVRQRDRATKQLYLNELASAQREWELNDVSAAWNHLKACPMDLRGWEHGYLVSQFAGGRLELDDPDRRVACIAYSPDGTRIASGSIDGSLVLWNAHSGDQIIACRGPEERIYGLAYSPDGKHLVSGGGISEDYHRPGAGPDVFEVRETGILTIWSAIDCKVLATRQVSNALVHSVAYFPDGGRIVGAAGASVKVWDAVSLDETAALGDHKQTVNCVAVNTDGKRIVSCSGFPGELTSTDNAIKVWDALSGQELLDLQGHTDAVMSAAFSPDGTQVVSGSEDHTLKVWSLDTGKEMLTLRGHDKPVLGVAYDPSGRRIVSGSEDNTVRIWHIVTQEMTQILRGHTSAVINVAINSDGTRIVSASRDSTINVWDWTSRDQPLAFDTSPVRRVASGANGTEIASLLGYNRFGDDFEHDRLEVRDTQSDEVVLSLPGRIDCFAFTPGESQVVTASGCAIKTVDARTGKEIRSVILDHQDHVAAGAVVADPRLPELPPDHFEAVAISPDTRRIVSFSFPWVWVKGEELPLPGAGRLTMWDGNTGKALNSLELTGRRFDVTIAYSPDSRWIACGSPDGSVLLWDTVGSDRSLTLTGHSGEILSLAFSPDGTHVVSGSEDQMIKVWDACDGKELLTIAGHEGKVNSVAYSPDGTRIVSGSNDRTVKLWDSATGDQTITLRGHGRPVLGVTFSRDGSRIASATEKEIKVWKSQRSDDTSASTRPR